MQEFIIQSLTTADVNTIAHKSGLKRRTEIRLLSSTLLTTLEYQIEVTDGITVTGDLICEN